MTFQPPLCPQARQGIVISVACFLFALAPIAGMIALPVGGTTFVLALLAMGLVVVSGYVLMRALTCLTLAYDVNRNGITITWLFAHYVVPISSIQQIVVGAADQGPGPWWTWPSRYAARLPGGPQSSVRALSTRPLPEQVLLITTQEVVGLSPTDPDAFVAAIQGRYRLGPTQILRGGSLWRLPVARWTVWTDPLGWGLLAMGLVGVLALFGWLSFAYPSLPAQIPLHYDIRGGADRIGPRVGLLALPIIGMLAWTVNGLLGGLIHPRQQVAAYLLWGGAIAVQILAGIALAGMI